MTPQELERTLDFIVHHEAQASIHIERLAARQGEMQAMMALMTELARVQSQRLDRHDETFHSMQDSLHSMQDSLHSMQALQKEALARLDQILYRLSQGR